MMRFLRHKRMVTLVTSVVVCGIYFYLVKTFYGHYKLITKFGYGTYSEVKTIIPTNFNFPTLISSSKQKTGNQSAHVHLWRKRAFLLNRNQKVHNTEVFGQHQSKDPVIIIQVHDRHLLFKHVLDSLKEARDINTTTIIISRDKFTHEMDNLIHSQIKFCRYLEIFFPFSMQLYPDSFPGKDPNDCPRNIPQYEAISSNCNNAKFPDAYGHYREVNYVQIKHHWFWKLNMVFSGIRDLVSQTGPILFLEEDHFVSTDIVYMMKMSFKERKTQCPYCTVINLSSFEETRNKYPGYFAVTTDVINLGLIVTKMFYNRMMMCVDEFCTYDDYNWDWTLQGVRNKCRSFLFKSMVSLSPHILHLGMCEGFHINKKNNCNITEEIIKYKTNNQNILFPNILNVQKKEKNAYKREIKNGGWGDERDHRLCKSFINISVDINYFPNGNKKIR